MTARQYYNQHIQHCMKILYVNNIELQLSSYIFPKRISNSCLFSSRTVYKYGPVVTSLRRVFKI